MVFAVVLLYVFLAGGAAKFQDTKLNSGDLTPITYDYLLCRLCGGDVSPIISLSSIECPASLKTRVIPLFGLKEVKVHTVKNAVQLTFDVIILTKAYCTGGTDDWQTENSWFPGYAYKSCVCFHCGRQIGWIFEPLHSANSGKIYPSLLGFYAVIVPSVVSEIYADSLIVVPKHFDASVDVF
ncbi:uncharacterized protein LOC126834116 [Adelges cooleyi]|uniref:uncharacterized protein LOC126834116 n=1 Tax=Adelges cooleyi TaxID=133065 RepID=UPI00217F600A|nr:uncharacterized protein LOC126834116 [Adelges cooleyi]XP_050421773.1 uncharacterized protein LOC126834116 [Adelges cooleyi]XP_050421774.1 uncharacterized protein LOC126834116 [Adelges cooleyi]